MKNDIRKMDLEESEKIAHEVVNSIGSTLIEFSNKSGVVLSKTSNGEFAIHLIATNGENYYLSDGNYKQNITSAVETYNNRVESLSLEDNKSVQKQIKDEINGIKEDLDSLDKRVECLNSLIASISPNLLGENGFFDEMAYLQEKANEAEKQGDPAKRDSYLHEIERYDSSIRETLELEKDVNYAPDELRKIAHDFINETSTKIDSLNEKLENSMKKFKEISNELMPSLFNAETVNVIADAKKINDENPTTTM